MLALTFNPTQEWDFSVKLMFNKKTKNTETGILSGDEVKADLSVSKTFEKMSVGVSGYFTKQTTFDEQNGVDLINSNQEGLAIGPQFKYDFKKLSIIGKFHKEFQMKNRFEGEKLQVKFIIPF